jgi:outer membrane protein assembly factor BamB
MNRICKLATASILLAGTTALPAWAAGVTVKASPAAGPPGARTNVSGSGFGTNEAIDIYFDTTDLLLDVTDDSGNFGADSLKVPASAAPGTHWITAIGRRDGIAGHVLFTVRTNWAEHGFEQRGRRNNPSENIIDATNVTGLDMAWTAATNGNVFSSPAYSGNIFVGSTDGNLYAFTASGTLKWKATTGGPIFSSPAIASGNVYVGSNDGKLYAFTANGGLKWSAVAGGPILSSPAVANGIVYVGCAGDGKVYAFNVTNGTPAWSAPAATGGLNYSSPAVAKGNVYIGSLDGRVYAFNAATGTSVWASTATAGIIESSPAVANGRVFVGSSDQKAYALNATSGNVEWVTNIGSGLLSSPAVANGTVYIGAVNGEVFALNANNGVPRWVGVMNDTIKYSSPAVGNGVVYIGSYDKALSAFATTGCGAQFCSPIWTGVTGGAIDSSPTLADGMVIVGSADQSLYVFAPNGGNNAHHRESRPPSYASLHPDMRLKPVRHDMRR